MTMDEMHSRPSREARQVIDALAELFDTVPPERAIEAEEELVEAGRDPSEVAAAMQRVAEQELGVPLRSARSAGERPPAPRTAGGRVGRVIGGPSRRWRSLGLLAAGFVAGILASTWLTNGTKESERVDPARQTARDRRPPERPLRLGPRQHADVSTARSIGDEGSRPSGERGPATAPESVTGDAQEPVARPGAVGGEDPTGEAVIEASSHALGALPVPGEGAEGVIAVLDADTWEIGTGRMPPELLRHYRDGEWWHAIHQLRAEVRLQDPALLEAGERNRDRFAIGEHGEVVEAATGRQSESIYGVPFPVIDAGNSHSGTGSRSDPRGATPIER
jgi:hypothetical protein